LSYKFEEIRAVPVTFSVPGVPGGVEDPARLFYGRAAAMRCASC